MGEVGRGGSEEASGKPRVRADPVWSRAGNVQGGGRGAGSAPAFKAVGGELRETDLAVEKNSPGGMVVDESQMKCESD